MTEIENSKQYDLEERTLGFAKDSRAYLRNLKVMIHNADDIKQLIRSSGSVAANYIEANESLSKKDFVHRIKICRKEAKETVLWLKLLDGDDKKSKELIQEATELMKIFGAILEKSK